MAIVFEGINECPLCGKVLDKSKTYMLTPPIISNMKDPLFELSDVGIHRNCLDKSNLKQNLLYHLEMYYNRFPIANSTCIIDGQLITEEKNVLSFGLLTSNSTEELSNFNYTVLNIKNVNFWQQRSTFLSLAKKFLNEHKWQGLGGFNYLEYLIGIIEKN